MIGLCCGVVAQDADAAFVGRSFDSEDDGLTVGIRFVEVWEVGWWRDGQVVERGNGAGWVAGCGGGRDGCHGDDVFLRF